MRSCAGLSVTPYDADASSSSARRRKPIATSFAATRGLDDRRERDLDRRVAHIRRRGAGRSRRRCGSNRSSNTARRSLVLRDLRDQQAREPVAHDEVVRAGDLGQRAVAQVEHLARDREVDVERRGDVAQVQQRDQRPRVGALRLEHVGVAEHDEVVVRLDVERVEQRPVGRVAARGLDASCSAGAARARRRTPRCAARSATTCIRRTRRDVRIELADDRGRAPVPAEHQRALRGCAGAARPSTDRLLARRSPARSGARCTVSSSSVITITRSPAAITAVHRGAELRCRPVGRHQPDHGRLLERQQRVAEGPPTSPARLPGRSRHRRSRAAPCTRPTGRTGGTSGPRCARSGRRRGSSSASSRADHPCDLEVRGIPDLRDDVVRLRTAARVVRDREDRLDHVRIAVRALGREHDDRARAVDARDLEVVEVDRAAGAADDAGAPVSGTRRWISSSISTLSRSARMTIAARALVRVGDDQFAGRW